MATKPYDVSRCKHGTPLLELCAPCVADPVETDPWFVLDFCYSAIEDAIGLEDGLDGAAGMRVLAMIRTAIAARPSRSTTSPQGAQTP